MSPLGSTAVNGSFTCSFQVFDSGCCSVMVKWLRGSTIVNSTLQYTIAQQYTYSLYSYFYYSYGYYAYTNSLSVNGTVIASHAGSYHCQVVSSLNSNMVNRSSSSLNLTVQSK